MLGNSWNKMSSVSVSQKVLNRVKPAVPLKSKLENAHNHLMQPISKLTQIEKKLKSKDSFILQKIVNAQRTHNVLYAKGYAAELVEIRKMHSMVSKARLSMEQIDLRLKTVSELGDVVVTLSPCMSIIKDLSMSLGGIMPEMNGVMQNLSSTLGDVMNDTSLNSSDAMLPSVNSNSDAANILQEVSQLIEGNAKSNIPEIPNNLTTPANKTMVQI